MTIAELIALLENRLRYNASLRSTAFHRGDGAAISVLDTDDTSTNQTLEALRALPQQ